MDKEQVSAYFRDLGKKGATKLKMTRSPEYWREIGRLGGKAKRGYRKPKDETPTDSVPPVTP